LIDTILNHGVENVFFLAKARPLRKVLFVSYTSSSDPAIEMMCKIDTSRYKLEDQYKITIAPIYVGYAKEDYYVTDLQSMLNRGYAKMLVQLPVEIPARKTLPVI
jgi:hypothetical protein